VREYLLQKYVQAIRDWRVDGLKLDFIDAFLVTNPSMKPGRDTQSVERAVVQLLDTVAQEIRRINPNALIEFRQPYIGPMMGRWASMLRAGDCPVDAIANRTRTLTMRLILSLEFRTSITLCIQMRTRL
jgi:alpha-galactosidase